MIRLIAALSRKTRAIGKDGDLIWNLPADLARFRQLTMGHPVIMGRKTWESLPEKYRPLPGRTNIVITHDASYDAPGALSVGSIEEAFAAAQTSPGADEICVIGGGQVYAAALPYADRLDLTLVDDAVEGDAYFPPYEDEFTKAIAEETDSSEGISYRWVELARP